MEEHPAGSAHRLSGPGGVHPAGVLDHAEQNFPAGVPVARIAQDDGGAEIWIERAGHLAFAVCASAGDYEGDTAALEVFDGREKIFQPTGSARTTEIPPYAVAGSR
ncbi:MULTISPECIES: hypothetical protein [unclassified Streptomyces]|uniref:hypothetical protein n=1 Tax=unclassified Streptomyces TaxID=2593676 RepID=UPI00371656B4